MVIDFSYIDVDGTPRHAMDRVSSDLDIASGDTIQIQFFPDDKDSAELARSRYLALIILLIGLAILSYYVWPVIREARDYANGARPKRNRRR